MRFAQTYIHDVSRVNIRKRRLESGVGYVEVTLEDSNGDNCKIAAFEDGENVQEVTLEEEG
jgi:hypothetical protein